MTGHHRVEIEEPLAGQSGGLGPHRVAVADGHDPDLRLVQLVDERHVREDIRIAHMVERLSPLGGDHEPARIAEIDGPSIHHIRGRMERLHESQVEVLVRQQTARVARIDLVDPVAGEIGGEFVHREQRGPRFLANLDAIAEVIFMTVGQRHMGRTVDDVDFGNACLFEGGIAGQKRIDQDAACAQLNTKTRMAKPRNLHRLTSRVTL